MGNLPTACQKHLREIPQAQLVAKSPENNQENDIGGIFEKIERSSCPLIESVLAI